MQNFESTSETTPSKRQLAFIESTADRIFCNAWTLGLHCKADSVVIKWPLESQLSLKLTILTQCTEQISCTAEGLFFWKGQRHLVDWLHLILSNCWCHKTSAYPSNSISFISFICWEQQSRENYRDPGGPWLHTYLDWDSLSHYKTFYRQHQIMTKATYATGDTRCAVLLNGTKHNFNEKWDTVSTKLSPV